mmetsp:Transcript_19744/g.27238  ORF Transcript_19744/g.27238 Transcript_19744/m.27238 type:complete len:103 (+) Transcript_19744:105-413(+)
MAVQKRLGGSLIGLFSLVILFSVMVKFSDGCAYYCDSCYGDVGGADGCFCNGGYCYGSDIVLENYPVLGCQADWDCLVDGCGCNAGVCSYMNQSRLYVCDIE